MKTASQLFSEADRAKIAEAVTRAENKTSGEIVPVVATSSGRYDRAEDIVGFITALALFVSAWSLFQDVIPLGGDWQSGFKIAFGPVMSVITLVFGFALGTSVATMFPALSLPFIPDSEMKEEVEEAAAQAFQQFRLRATADATGILIYVSLFEHKVRVIGDDSIAKKLGQSDWEEVVKLVTAGLAEGHPTDGFVTGIEKCGELLSAHFPRSDDDADELSNELRIIE